MPEPGDQEEKSFSQQMVDIDFADKFYKNIINAIVMFAVLIIISITLFWGQPDLVDAMTTAINGESSCQN